MVGWKDLKEKIANKAKTYGLALAMTLPVASCAPIQDMVEQRQQRTEIRHPMSVEREAREVLGIENQPSRLVRLPEGYFTKQHTDIELEFLAAVRAGKACITQDEYVLNRPAGYGFGSSKEDLVAILKKADVNNDRIITRDESRNLRDKMYNSAINDPEFVDAYIERFRTAKDLLGVKSIDEMIELPNNYLTRKDLVGTLNNLTGVANMRVIPKKIDGEITYKGTFNANIIDNVNSYVETLENADFNGDKIITPKEVKHLEKLYFNAYQRLMEKRNSKKYK